MKMGTVIERQQVSYQTHGVLKLIKQECERAQVGIVAVRGVGQKMISSETLSSHRISWSVCSM